MLLSADWVLPVCQPPIRDGAVLIDGRRIAAVGELARLRADHPHEPHEHFAGCTMHAGARQRAHPPHAHRTGRRPRVARPSPSGCRASSRRSGRGRSRTTKRPASSAPRSRLACGVTVVGDIAYGAAEVASASAAGLGGVYYWELLGLDADDVAAQLD